MWDHLSSHIVTEKNICVANWARNASKTQANIINRADNVARKEISSLNAKGAGKYRLCLCLKIFNAKSNSEYRKHNSNLVKQKQTWVSL